VLGVDAEELRLPEVGVHLDLVDRGTTDVAAIRSARWSGIKLLTPIARTTPSSRSFSSAW
jgi:hypothetical protein